MKAVVIRVESDSYDESWKFTVKRPERHRGLPVPAFVDDVPADIREALLEWLTKAF
ncbi:hypothetical protein RCF19_03985 [Rhodococcus qingshengii]